MHDLMSAVQAMTGALQQVQDALRVNGDSVLIQRWQDIEKVFRDVKDSYFILMSAILQSLTSNLTASRLAASSMTVFLSGERLQLLLKLHLTRHV
jgi:hypothetical protein